MTESSIGKEYSTLEYSSMSLSTRIIYREIQTTMETKANFRLTSSFADRPLSGSHLQNVKNRFTNILKILIIIIT